MENSGSYVCSVSNGLSSVNSSVELSIIGGALELAVISNDTSLNVGETAVLICVGYGQPSVDITWTKDGQVISNSSLVSVYEEDLAQGGRVFKQSFLQLCSLQMENSGSYFCSVSNGLSSVNSSVELSVIGGALELAVISNDTSLNVGETAVLICVGYGQPSVDIVWTKDGQVISNMSLVSVYEEDLAQGGRVFKQSFLQLCSLQIENSGSYVCSVSNGLSSVNSSVELSVIGGALELAIMSNDTSLNVGETAVLICVGYGQPSIDIAWTKDGQVISNSSLVSVYEEDLAQGGRVFKQSFLQLCSLQMENSGSYVCSVSNGLSSVNSSVELSVIGGALELAVISNDTSLNVGETAVLICVGYGQPSVDIAWTKDGQVISNSSLVSVYEEDLAQGGRVFKQSFLQLCSLQMENSGSYVCSVSNGLSSINSSVELTVAGIPAVRPTVVIFSNNSLDLDSGTTLVLTCVANGNPTPTISWLKDNTTIIESSNVKVDREYVAQGGHNYSQSFLTLCGVVISDSGIYTCVAENIAGIASNYSVINVFARAQILMVPNNTVLNAGESLHVYCTAEGNSPSITWLRQGTEISNVTDERIQVYNIPSVVNGTTVLQSMLLILHTRSADSGSYVCLVVSQTTRDEHNFTVIVNSIPATVYSFPPTQVIGIYQGNITIQSMARGYPLPQITWYRDNKVLLQDNNVIISSEVVIQGEDKVVIFSLLLSDNELLASVNISGMVNNGLSGGNVTSFKVYISVQRPVYIVNQPPSTIISMAQENLTIDCTVSGQIPINVRWFFTSGNSTILVPEHLQEVSSSMNTITSQLALSQITPLDEGLYFCRASNNITGYSTFSIDSNFTELLVYQKPNLLSTRNESLTTAMPGENASLIVVVDGSPNPSITSDMVVWYKLGTNTPITPSSRVKFAPDGLSISFSPALTSDSGDYIVVINHPTGQFLILVSLEIRLRIALELIQVGELNVTAAYGDDKSFTCTATGLPLPTITWTKNGALISMLSRRITTSINNGSTNVSSSLSISGLVPSDEGYYNCKAVQDNTFLVTSFHLTVTLSNPCDGNPCLNLGVCEPDSLTYVCRCPAGFTGPTCATREEVFSGPAFVEVPVLQEVMFSERAVFRCRVGGNPKPTIQWYKDEVQLNRNGPVLEFFEAGLQDRGFYSCVATNTEGQIRSPSAVLRLTDIIDFKVPVVLIIDVPQVHTYITAFVSLLQGLNTGNVINGQQSFLIHSIGLFGGSVDTSVEPSMNDSYTVSLLVIVQVIDSSDVSNIIESSASLMNGIAEEIIQLSEKAGVSNIQVLQSNITSIDSCDSETQRVTIEGQDYGSIIWPASSIGNTILVSCPCDTVEISQKATRTCGGNFVSGAAWLQPELSSCELPTLVQQACLKNFDRIPQIIRDTGEISADYIKLTFDAINESLIGAVGNATVSEDMFDILDSILGAPLTTFQSVQESDKIASQFLKGLNSLIDGYPLVQDTHVISKSHFGCLIHQISSARSSLEFRPGLENGQIQLLGTSNPVATFTLPRSAIEQTRPMPQSIAFCIFMDESLFVRRNSYLQQTNRTNFKLGSYVITSRFGEGIKVRNLQEPVTMNFVRREDVTGSAECSFWDRSLDDEYGAWSKAGCSLIKDGQDSTSCRCNHLTNFAILVDSQGLQQDQNVGIAIDQNIGIAMIVGPLVLLVCAIFTFVCLIITSGFRSSPTGIFLGNLCVSVFFLCVVFLVALFVGGSTVFCTVVAFLFHYFVLVVSLALPTMAFFMGFSPLAGKKLTILHIASIISNWVLPAIVVVLCIALAGSDYKSSHEKFMCRPESYPYTLGLMLIGGLMVVLTLILLIVLFFRSKNDSDPTPKSGTSRWYMEYVGLVLVAACFFLAWGFGLPATRPLNLGILRLVFQIFFLIFCLMCGVFMVLFFCLLHPQVRDALCCRNKGHFDITENPYFPEQLSGGGDHAYVMENRAVKDEGEGGLHYKNEAVDYTFNENLYEPYEADAAPGVNVAFVLPAEVDGQEPDVVKKNLATLDDEDMESATKF